MSLKRREVILGGFYLALLAGIGVYLFFFRFTYPRFKAVIEKISTAEDALLRINKVLNSKKLVEKKFNAFEQKFNTKASDQNSTTLILQDIKGKASDAGLNVINIKPLSRTGEGLYAEFDFKLETEGYLQNLGKFLYDLDNSPYIFNIKYTQINAQAFEEPLKVQLLLSAALVKGRG